MPSSPLISAHELHDLLEAGPGIRLLDVRYRLDKPDGLAPLSRRLDPS